MSVPLQSKPVAVSCSLQQYAVQDKRCSMTVIWCGTPGRRLGVGSLRFSRFFFSLLRSSWWHILADDGCSSLRDPTRTLSRCVVQLKSRHNQTEGGSRWTALGGRRTTMAITGPSSPSTSVRAVETSITGHRCPAGELCRVVVQFSL